jgi:hypothetical protein
VSRSNKLPGLSTRRSGAYRGVGLYFGGRIRGCEERRDAYVSATGDKDAEAPNGCPSVSPRLKEQVKWPQPVRVLVVQRRPPGDKAGPAPFSDGYRGGRSCTRWGKKERSVQF